MFTGIVKEVGRVERITKSSALTKLGISSKVVYEESGASDSISLNGVCLTLVAKERGILFFEVVESTLKSSNLGRLKRGNFINLEPSLKLQDKLGGHFVLGHTDCEVRIKRLIKQKSFWELEVEIPHQFKQFVLKNGSVTLEGISLTIKKIVSNRMTCMIIPFTAENTNLKYKRVGDWLNIEFDYLLKQKVAGNK